MSLVTDKVKTYKAIEDHYRKNASTTISKLRNSLGHHTAEDTVQEAYARACRYWQTYDEALDFKAWIGGILMNCIRDSKKSEALRGMVQEGLVVVSDPPRHDATDTILANEIAERIKQQSPVKAYILKLYLLEGYTGDEVHEVTGYTPQAVRQIVSRFKNEVETYCENIRSGVQRTSGSGYQGMVHSSQGP